MGSTVELPAFLLEVFNATKEEPQEEEVSEIAAAPRVHKEIKRTAMGEYVPDDEDGKPLTSLGIPGPGPANYFPKINFTRTEAPHYSVKGKYTLKQKLTPGPANYSTGQDLSWKRRKLSLKGRSRSMYDEEEKKAASDIGAARYNVKVNETGTKGPKYSLKQRNIHSGLPNSLVNPIDVPGFETPGPDYLPPSDYFSRGLVKSFGCSRQDTDHSGKYPGPTDYTIPESSRGPAYSLAKRIPKSDKEKAARGIPAPNAYDIGTTIGKAVAMSMTARREDLLAQKIGPSPNSYSLKSTLAQKNNAKTLAYKWFETEVPYQPGPGDYNLKPEVIQPRNPAYSLRKRTVMTYPENKALKTDGAPGPATYKNVKAFSKNDKPAYSMGHRTEISPDDEKPAPNKYRVEKYPKPSEPKAPSFSMGKRINRDISTEGPGPAAYLPVVPRGGPSYSISKRSKSLKAFKNPAPNAYMPELENDTRIGVKFKGRPSPWIYSGRRTTNLEESTVC